MGVLCFALCRQCLGLCKTYIKTYNHLRKVLTSAPTGIYNVKTWPVPYGEGVPLLQKRKKNIFYVCRCFKLDVSKGLSFGKIIPACGRVLKWRISL